MDKLIYIGITLVCSIILMIIHEFPKNIAYYILKHKEGKKVSKNIFYFWKNIDPVGVITSIAMYTPFSKQYKYTISNKKTSLILGITGITTLVVLYALSIATLLIFFKDYINNPADLSNEVEYYIFISLLNFSLLCMSMILVNLFPVTCFDVGLIILGSNSKKRGGIIVFDGFLKLIFFFLVALGVLSNTSSIITNMILSLFI